VRDDSGEEVFFFALKVKDRDGKWLTEQAMFLGEGDYYIDLSASSGTPAYGHAYSLRLTHKPAVAESEFNNDSGTADSVRLGQTVNGSLLSAGGGDWDFYSFAVPSDGRVVVDLRYPTVAGAGDAMHVRVRDDSGDEVFFFPLQVNQKDGKWLAKQAMFLGKGNYFVDLSAGSGTLAWGHAYSLKLTHTPMVTESEFNNDTQTADRLALGRTVKGSLLSASGSDWDFYYFDLPSAGSIRIDLRSPSVSGTGDAYHVRLRNDAGDVMHLFEVASKDKEGKALAGQTIALKRGHYFIDVSGNDGFSAWGKEYSLNVAMRVANTKVPSIGGTAKVGKTLTAAKGSWSPSSVTATYQWLRDGKAIKGATAAKYKLVAADAGKKITVKVTASKTSYVGASKTSKAKTVALQKLTKTPKPKVSGTAKVGKKLTAKPGAWKPKGVKLSYQWLRGGKSIKGATTSTYKVVKADVGKKLSVKVTGKKSGYKTVSKTSSAKAAKK
jgi:hypothetical protein